MTNAPLSRDPPPQRLRGPPAALSLFSRPQQPSGQSALYPQIRPRRRGQVYLENGISPTSPAAGKKSFYACSINGAPPPAPSTPPDFEPVPYICTMTIPGRYFTFAIILLISPPPLPSRAQPPRNHPNHPLHRKGRHRRHGFYDRAHSDTAVKPLKPLHPSPSVDDSVILTTRAELAMRYPNSLPPPPKTAPAPILASTAST